jgi:hypothetical protein
MATKRRYSDDERANALAALAANAGNVTRTARQLGIPRATLVHWADGDRHPEAMIMGEGKRRDMAEALVGVAWQLLDAIPSKIDNAPLLQTATSLGIAIDKARLLRGEPTTIEGHVAAGELARRAAADPELAAHADRMLERLAVRRNGAAATGVAGDPGAADAAAAPEAAERPPA